MVAGGWWQVEVTAEAVREWHLPYGFALDMHISKYADRFKLAFSSASRALELRLEQITVVSDFVVNILTHLDEEAPGEAQGGWG